MNQESQAKLKKEFDFSGYVFHIPMDQPCQLNAYDCGIFCLETAKRIYDGKPLDYGQQDIPKDQG